MVCHGGMGWMKLRWVGLEEVMLSGSEFSLGLV